MVRPRRVALRKEVTKPIGITPTGQLSQHFICLSIRPWVLVCVMAPVLSFISDFPETLMKCSLWCGWRGRCINLSPFSYICITLQSTNNSPQYWVFCLFRYVHLRRRLPLYFSLKIVWWCFCYESRAISLCLGGGGWGLTVSRPVIALVLTAVLPSLPF